MNTRGGLLLLALLVAGCDSVDSSRISTGNIVADIEAYRLTAITPAETVPRLDVVVILRSSTGSRPYLRLSGGDELLLLVDGSTRPFTREDVTGTSVIRYVTSWDESIDTRQVVTVRFTRGSGAVYDSSVTIDPPPVIDSPEAGFEWDPDRDDLEVSWQTVDPPVDDAAVVTACTEYYRVIDTSGLTFTVPQDTLVRTSTSINRCTGYVELVQERVDGDVASRLDEDSRFQLDQVTQLDVTATY